MKKIDHRKMRQMLLGKQHNLSEIARAVGCTREYVRQVYRDDHGGNGRDLLHDICVSRKEAVLDGFKGKFPYLLDNLHRHLKKLGIHHEAYLYGGFASTIHASTRKIIINGKLCLASTSYFHQSRNMAYHKVSNRGNDPNALFRVYETPDGYYVIPRKEFRGDGVNFYIRAKGYTPVRPGWKRKDPYAKYLEAWGQIK